MRLSLDRDLRFWEEATEYRNRDRLGLACPVNTKQRLRRGRETPSAARRAGLRPPPRLVCGLANQYHRRIPASRYPPFDGRRSAIVFASQFTAFSQRRFLVDHLLEARKSEVISCRSLKASRGYKFLGFSQATPRHLPGSSPPGPACSSRADRSWSSGRPCARAAPARCGYPPHPPANGSRNYAARNAARRSLTTRNINCRKP